MQKLFNDDIKLIEDIHRYELKDDPSFEFTSCTTFAKYFFFPFDKIGIANRLTATHPKYAEKSPQELVADWNLIAEEGTFIHAEVENFINDKTTPTHPKSKLAVDWLKNNVCNNDRYEIHSEVIVYSKELELAGTIDILICDKKTGTYKLLDWKTNRRIDTKSFNNKMGVHSASSHLMDCNFYHYSIQLSLYRFILEKYYGITISGAAISHLTDNEVIILNTDYHKEEIEDMIRADRVALKQFADENLTTEFV